MQIVLARAAKFHAGNVLLACRDLAKLK